MQKWKNQQVGSRNLKPYTLTLIFVNFWKTVLMEINWFQVLKTHLDNVRKIDPRQHQPADVDDEKLKEIGKSNLDKWLQALLFKDAESVSSSPGRDAQITSPALSQISMAAMRESLELASRQVRRPPTFPFTALQWRYSTKP
jgi:hypothetical protein